MNGRPFDLHRPPAINILRGSATQLAAQISEKVRESGAQAYESGIQTLGEMSFAVPKNVPSFSSPQRELENKYWGASGVTARSAHSNGGVMSGMQDRMGGLFGENKDLPMYKDKPYSYATSKRHRPLWKRRRLHGLGLLLLLVLLWFFGVFKDDTVARQKAKDTWRWLQRPEKGGPGIDWFDRRERVKEAFELSWDAYERYAWG